jgi:hypothetical protein
MVLRASHSGISGGISEYAESLPAGRTGFRVEDWVLCATCFSTVFDQTWHILLPDFSGQFLRKILTLYICHYSP